MNRRADSAQERAELLFFIYYQRGPSRSIKGLHADLKTMGVPISEATLKRYSARFKWQERIATLDAQARRQQDQRAVEGMLTMYERHTQLARALQGAAGTALQSLLTNDSRLTNLKPADIARLVDLGLRAERNAVGASSDRREITIEIWNDVVSSIVQVFAEVNQEPDPEVRAQRFALRVDRLVDARLAEAGEKGD